MGRGKGFAAVNGFTVVEGKDTVLIYQSVSKILDDMVLKGLRNAILGGYVKEYTTEFYRKYGGEGKW